MARVPHGLPRARPRARIRSPRSAPRARRGPPASCPTSAAARGPRTSHDAAAGERTVLAYRAWAQRAGGQDAAFAGESSWTPERRFDRLFERLALPGFGRGGPLRAARRRSAGSASSTCAPPRCSFTDDAATTAAKRVFGIGDKILLERRARDLADAVEVPIEALDLALFNWGAPAAERATMGSQRGRRRRRARRHRRRAGRLTRTRVHPARHRSRSASRLPIRLARATGETDMTARTKLLKELVRDAHYVVDERAIAEAILVRSMARRVLPDVSFRSTPRPAAGALVSAAPGRAVLPADARRAPPAASLRR